MAVCLFAAAGRDPLPATKTQFPFASAGFVLDVLSVWEGVRETWKPPRAAAKVGSDRPVAPWARFPRRIACRRPQAPTGTSYTPLDSGGGRRHASRGLRAAGRPGSQAPMSSVPVEQHAGPGREDRSRLPQVHRLRVPLVWRACITARRPPDGEQRTRSTRGSVAWPARIAPIFAHRKPRQARWPGRVCKMKGLSSGGGLPRHTPRCFGAGNALTSSRSARRRTGLDYPLERR